MRAVSETAKFSGSRPAPNVPSDGPEQGIARYDCGQHQSKLPPVAEVLHVRLRPREPSAQAGSRGRRLALEEGSGEQPPAAGCLPRKPLQDVRSPPPQPRPTPPPRSRA